MEINDDGIIADLVDFEPDPPERRNVCLKCRTRNIAVESLMVRNRFSRRPCTVCWCPYLPREPLSVTTKVYILQHPFEEGRRLQTAPMIYNALKKGHCHIYKGKRFNLNKNMTLRKVVDDPYTLLLYPGPEATDCEQLVQQDFHKSAQHPYNLIVLDGTWLQARGIYCQNHFLQNLKQVQLKNTGLSEYVIRTQPTDGSLSTVESVAVAISVLESRPEIRELMVRPLRALCDFQLQRGAEIHHSKEHLIEQGLYTKQLPKASQKLSKTKSTVEEIPVELDQDIDVKNTS